MSAVGIIAEFNPLHCGHKMLIEKAKEKGTVVCILSGNFTQRGDTAVFDKRERAKAALSCGADIVIELPVLWSMSTAQNFALGGVSAAVFAGCDTLMFGSECGNIKELETAAEIICGNDFSQKLEKYLKSGVTFAAARQSAAEECGIKGELLSGANNNLAVEYIVAARKLIADLKFETVKRIGSAHDSAEISECVSASLLREKLKENDTAFCEKYMPKEAFDIFKKAQISDIKRIEKAILAELRMKTEKELAMLPDLSEGIENRLYNAIKTSVTTDELYEKVKSKRYTMSRVRRLVLSAFLEFDNSFFLNPLPYIRVLGMNKKGEEYIKSTLSLSPVPVILRTSDIKKLSEDGKKVFNAESRATDVFALSLRNPMECGLEYTAKIIKTE